LGLKKLNPFGLYDMHGNVWEWVEDHWQGNHEGASTDGSACLTGDDRARRVLRGGAWKDFLNYLRFAFRDVNLTVGRVVILVVGEISMAAKVSDWSGDPVRMRGEDDRE
jgi:formylglycine-generating enzyme required for sulfatase activity